MATNSGEKLTSETVKVMTNEEWAKRLEPEQYFVTRERGTEAVSYFHKYLQNWISNCTYLRY